MLTDIRGLRLTIETVAATFKYDDQTPKRHRVGVAGRLDLRDTGRDVGAAAQQRRRLGRLAE
jgi:transcriptional regulator